MSTFVLGVLIFLGVFAFGIVLFLLFAVLPETLRARKDDRIESAIASSDALWKERKATEEKLAALNLRLDEMEKRAAETGNDIEMLFALSARRPGRKKAVDVHFAENDETKPYAVLAFMG